MKGRRNPRTEEEYYALIEERIKQLPKSAPECQLKQHSDKRKDTKTRLTAFIVNGKETYVMVVQEISGKYNLPGGRRKRGEHATDGIFREICEETGLELTRDDIADMKNYSHDMFYIKLTESDIDNIFVSIGPEINEVLWYPLEYLLQDLEKNDSPFSMTTINLLSTIRKIIGKDYRKFLPYEDLKQAVLDSNVGFIDENLDYYSVGQINGVLPIAIQVATIPIIDKLLDYATIYVYKLVNLAIARKRNDVAKYLIDNFHNDFLMEEALKTASETNNKEIVEYVRNF